MPRSTTHHFPINLADPRTLGWGGVTLGDRRGNAAVCTIASFVLILGMYDKSSGPFLTATWGIWAPLWLFIIIYCLKHDAYISMNQSPKPRVICDPRGLTCHNIFSCIQYQWRWSELKAVEYQRQPQRALRITPLRGSTVVYRSGRLDYEDYRTIVKTVHQYLSGCSPALPASPPATVDHIWYERRDILSKDGIIMDYWTLLIVFCSQPVTLQVIYSWPDKWASPPPSILHNFYPFVVASFLLLDLYLVHYIFQRCHALYVASPYKYAAINKEGLYFYQLRGKVLKLLWQDIRFIDAVRRKYTRYHQMDIKVIDRLGHCRTIGNDSGRRESEITNCINDVLAGKALLTLPPCNNVILKGDIFLFCLNTLFGCLLMLEEIFYNLGTTNFLTIYRDFIFYFFVFLMLGLNILILYFREKRS